MNLDYSKETKSIGIGLFIKTITLYYLFTNFNDMPVIVIFGIGTLIGRIIALLVLIIMSDK